MGSGLSCIRPPSQRSNTHHPTRFSSPSSSTPTGIDVDHLYTKPSGLYPHCAWDVKHVRRLILRRELAPRYPGLDDPRPGDEECPICMLAYPILNATKCCAGRLCTECYLQIRPPRHNKQPCPFCKQRRVEAILQPLPPGSNPPTPPSSCKSLASTPADNNDDTDNTNQLHHHHRHHQLQQQQRNVIRLPDIPNRNGTSNLITTATTRRTLATVVSNHLQNQVVDDDGDDDDDDDDDDCSESQTDTETETDMDRDIHTEQYQQQALTQTSQHANNYDRQSPTVTPPFPLLPPSLPRDAGNNLRLFHSQSPRSSSSCASAAAAAANPLSCCTVPSSPIPSSTSASPVKHPHLCCACIHHHRTCYPAPHITPFYIDPPSRPDPLVLEAMATDVAPTVRSSSSVSPASSSHTLKLQQHHSTADNAIDQERIADFIHIPRDNELSDVDDARTEMETGSEQVGRRRWCSDDKFHTAHMCMTDVNRVSDDEMQTQAPNEGSDKETRCASPSSPASASSPSPSSTCSSPIISPSNCTNTTIHVFNNAHISSVTLTAGPSASLCAEGGTKSPRATSNSNRRTKCTSRNSSPTGRHTDDNSNGGGTYGECGASDTDAKSPSSWPSCARCSQTQGRSGAHPLV